MQMPASVYTAAFNDYSVKSRWLCKFWEFENSLYKLWTQLSIVPEIKFNYSFVSCSIQQELKCWQNTHLQLFKHTSHILSPWICSCGSHTFIDAINCHKFREKSRRIQELKIKAWWWVRFLNPSSSSLCSFIWKSL